MSDGVSGLDVAGIVGGIATLSGGLWAGVKWLFGRADRREAQLDEKEKALVTRLEARVASLEERDEKRETEHREALAKLDRVLTACTLLVKDYELHNPGSIILAQAKALLARDFPHLFKVSKDTPADMQATLSRLN